MRKSFLLLGFLVVMVVLLLVAPQAGKVISAAARQEHTQGVEQTRDTEQMQGMGHMQGMGQTQGMDMTAMCNMMMDHSDVNMSGQCMSMMLKGKHRDSLVKALQADKDLLASLKSVIAEAEKKQ